MLEADVLVIGAGALGVSVAHHLGQRGQKVLVLERETTFAQHASSKNAGMFRQLYRHPQLTDWAVRSVKTWPKEAKSVAFEQTGSLIVAREIPSHHMSLFTQREIELPEGNKPAVFTAEDGLLTPYDLIHGIFQATNRELVRYRFQEEVLELEQVGDGWEVRTQKNTFRAPWVVNAAGAWINQFLQPKLPKQTVAAQPFARHLFVVEGWEEGFMPAPNVGYYWDETDAWYLRLWERNARLVSICDQVPAMPEQFVPAPDITERVALRLMESVPGQAEQLSLGPSWFCFRTYTEDLLPVWGEDEACKGLFWLAAFGGFGMSTSFAAAEDAARVICGENLSISSDFLPTRVQTYQTPSPSEASAKRIR